MATSCSDVCEAVHEMLLELGFQIDGKHEDHSDMLEALGKVTMVGRVEDALDYIRDKAPDRSDFAVFVWELEDVTGYAKQEKGKRITDDQGRTALRIMRDNHDCELGVNWETVNCAIDEVLNQEKEAKKRQKKAR